MSNFTPLRNADVNLYDWLLVSPAKALGDAHIPEPKHPPLRPLGAEGVVVRWGKPLAANRDATHLNPPTPAAWAPPSPPASGRRGAKSAGNTPHSKCAHTLERNRGPRGQSLRPRAPGFPLSRE